MSAADDALAIANLKARYCRAADTASEDIAAACAMFADIFTEDFVGDYGFGTMTGPGEVVDFLCGAIGRGSVWMIHMLHSPRIEIDGDRAIGEWTVTAQSRRHDGEMAVVMGRYTDVFRRTAAGWRIARIGLWRPA